MVQLRANNGFSSAISGAWCWRKHLRVVVDLPVRRIATPISKDLTAHPGIDKARNPPSSKGVHSDAQLEQLQLRKNGVKVVLARGAYMYS